MRLFRCRRLINDLLCYGFRSSAIPRYPFSCRALRTGLGKHVREYLQQKFPIPLPRFRRQRFPKHGECLGISRLRASNQESPNDHRGGFLQTRDPTFLGHLQLSNPRIQSFARLYGLCDSLLCRFPSHAILRLQSAPHRCSISIQMQIHCQNRKPPCTTFICRHSLILINFRCNAVQPPK